MFKNLRRNQLSTHLVWLAVLIGLLALSVFTFKLPERSADSSVGTYQFGAFPSGLALYSGQGASYYYSISPLNDYFITTDGYRMTLISAEGYNSKSFRSSAQPGQLKKATTTITQYFGSALPTYEVYRDDRLRYTTKRIDSDTIEVTRSIDLPTNKKVSVAAVTLSYDDLTYVFSPTSGSVFSNQSEAEIKWLEEQTGIALTKSEVPTEFAETRLFTWELESNTVVLFNPGQAGYLVIQTGVNQSLLVNPKDKLIEVIETVTPDTRHISSTIRISVQQELPTQ
jgi:hypothetical protein